MVNSKILTLNEFTLNDMQYYPNATGELAGLIRDIALAAKRINAEVNKAGLVDILGDSGTINIQGEEVKKLDEYANSQFVTVLDRGKTCAGVASEEMNEFVAFKDKVSMASKYICMFDPLDGSSNIDVNISIGSIFGIYRRLSQTGSPVEAKDFLQPGSRQVAAGYIIYGSSTILVYATSKGVNGFTLDQTIGEFCLSHPGILCPETGKIYSINHGNYYQFDDTIKRYLASCQQNIEHDNKPFTLRYTGSMVSDLHRNLLKGGIFLYPATEIRPEGKLRLMYECNPMAYIIEKAGGLATDGVQRILSKKPRHLHDRSALFAGSLQLMQTLEACCKNAC